MVGADEALGRPGRLPQELSSFVGRTSELAAVEDRLGSSRLVSLTGPGGSGKSRLALRVAAALTPRFPDVRLVELAPLVGGALVPATVAQALGLQDRAGGTPVDDVADAVGDRRLLLILDNCEPSSRTRRGSSWPWSSAAPGSGSWPPVGSGWTFPARWSSPSCPSACPSLSIAPSSASRRPSR